MTRLTKVAGLTALGAAAAAILERLLVAAPRYYGPASDHFDGRRFHNHQPVWQPEGSFLQWMMNRKPGRWRDWVDVAPGPAPEQRVSDGRLKLTLVNHATTLIQMDGLNILTDPIWSERCSPVSFAGPKRHRPPAIQFDDLPPIDIVLISHNHYDHLDLPTLRSLQRVHHPLIVTPLGNGGLLARHDVDGARELDWWEALDVSSEVRVTVVPAQHFSARGMSDRDAALWGGFVISGPAGHVYFAGDTGWGQHFGQVRERFGTIRLALIPIGAYLPRWFMKPVHIDPSEAVDAHLALAATTSVPMHYGTFNLGDDGETEPVEDLRRALAAKRVMNFEIVEFGRGMECR